MNENMFDEMSIQSSKSRMTMVNITMEYNKVYNDATRNKMFKYRNNPRSTTCLGVYGEQIHPFVRWLYKV